MTPIETITHAGVKIGIYPDDDAESPRDWDNIGKMICFHKRYNLGDEHDYKHEDYGSWAELEKAIRKNEDAAIVLPLYLYDHSGLRIKVGSFVGHAQHAEWDSGQVGFIVASRAKVIDEYGKKRLTKKAIARATKYLEGEVETYDQFLSGQVYGYMIEEDADGEELPASLHDSCWGMYGFDYCVGEAKRAAEHIGPKIEGAKPAGHNSFS